MCGINGIIGLNRNTIEQISRMNDRIIHRGPDDSGVWQNDSGTVSFGHRRLSIIDLSSAGAQPMVSASGEYTITYNGEIYNYLEIKQQLQKEHPGIQFRGNSDTELLINSIEQYGVEKTLDTIKGMFAFAVYEKSTGNVYVARDRMGEKPLYYGKSAGNLVFASDIASIERLDGFNNEFNGEVLSSYFKGGYIPAPYTIYKDIFKLEPGCYLVFKKNTDGDYEWPVKERYWNIREVAKNGQSHLFEGDFKEASEKLEGLIVDSIRHQMIADVPLGAFLSGGIDSTLVVALMQSISREPVRSFTIGFDKPEYNEAQYAKETAAHLGTKHTEMYVTKEDILGVIDDIPTAYSEPFADSSQIPTMLVSRMTRQHVTVSLSGDSGDEFFCGYNTYKDVVSGLDILNNKLSFLKGDLRKSVGKLANLCGGNRNEFMHKLSVVLNINTPEEWYRNVREDNILVAKLSRCKKPSLDYIDMYNDGYLEGAESNLMLLDMLQYLPDDILVKVDRAGMFYSLENRVPLLDRDVMEFAWSLPQEYKYDGITTKKILRDILYRYVPEEMMNRPKKGFSVPLAEWLRGDELSDWADDMIQTGQQFLGEYIDYKVFNKIWDRFMTTGEHEGDVWNMLMLSQWCSVRR